MTPAATPAIVELRAATSPSPRRRDPAGADRAGVRHRPARRRDDRSGPAGAAGRSARARMLSLPPSVRDRRVHDRQGPPIAAYAPTSSAPRSYRRCPCSCRCAWEARQLGYEPSTRWLTSISRRPSAERQLTSSITSAIDLAMMARSSQRSSRARSRSAWICRRTASGTAIPRTRSTVNTSFARVSVRASSQVCCMAIRNSCSSDVRVS